MRCCAVPAAAARSSRTGRRLSLREAGKGPALFLGQAGRAIYVGARRADLGSVGRTFCSRRAGGHELLDLGIACQHVVAAAPGFRENREQTLRVATSSEYRQASIRRQSRELDVIA